MDGNLLDLTANELFKKFGAGSHKPGSGSAAAFQGMLSAQLISTVIQLTTKKDDYKKWHPELLKMDTEIKNRIFPALQKLFQDDSIQFDKTVRLRKDRDNEKNSKLRKQLAIQANEELKPATEMPIEIAKLCEELAGYAVFVFDHGFRSVRGDSGVALNSAVSAIGGCLSIIDLNLLSFNSDKWTEEIRKETNRLRTVYMDLTSNTNDKLEILKNEVDNRYSYLSDIEYFISGKWNDSKLSYDDIEEIAKKLQNTLWKYRSKIWKENVPGDPKRILNPEYALTTLGYNFDQPATLGQHEVNGSMVEIAGIIDKENKKVSISKQFSPEVQRFTAAHELGHAILHKQRILHRDRALDGSAVSGPRNRQELQADKFASYFLMPKKQVENVFQELFMMEKFVINEETVFALKEKSVSGFINKFTSPFELARYLAKVEYFHGRPFNSISKIFGVSGEAMAIRLEELELIEY